MLLGSGREDSPRRGCPSPGGAGSAPRGGSRVLTEYSPVLTSAGAARSGAEGGARSRGRCPHPAAPTLYARPRALIGQAASRQVTSPNSPRIPRTPPTPPISGTPPKLGVRDPPPRASPEGRRPGGQGEAQGGRGGPGGSCRGVRGWGGVPVPPVGSSPGRASRAKRAGCLGKPAPPRSLQSRYGQDLKGAGPEPRCPPGPPRAPPTAVLLPPDPEGSVGPRPCPPPRCPQPRDIRGVRSRGDSGSVGKPLRGGRRGPGGGHWRVQPPRGSAHTRG